MSDEEFAEIAVNFYADQMSKATDQLVTLRAQLDTALASGDEAPIRDVSIQIHAMVSDIPWGSIPSAMLSLAGQVVRERGHVLLLLDVLHETVKQIRASVRELEIAGVNANLLVPLLDASAVMDEAIAETPYERVGDE